MPLLSWMQPRDPVMAARTVALLCGVGVTVTVVTFPIVPSSGATTNPVLLTTAIASFGLAILISGSVTLLDEASRWVWALCPLLAVTAITLVDLATQDASIRAQIFFIFSALYGGALLPRRGALVMTVWSLLGEAVVVLSLLPVRDAVTNLIYMGAALLTTTVLLVRSAERQAALVAVLEQRAATDSLTGLVNRRVFDEVLAVTLAQQTGMGAPVGGTALIVLDVDRFKSINDQFGHPGGDEILVQLSELLVATSRRGDVVCRLGGDEMAVLMPGCVLDAATGRAEQIVSVVRAHRFALGLDSINVSISAGVAHSPTQARDSRALYAAADAALYEAKRAGRDRVVANQTVDR
jgi:diguanylate cyclase (GGDEF)-like protein